MQTRTRPGVIDSDTSTASRISRNKTALRNKLLKNAKSIQRNRCRSDNISAVIESVVKKCHEIDKRLGTDAIKNVEDENKKDAKEQLKEGTSKAIGNKISGQDDKTVRPRVIGRPKILDKRGNMKTKKQFQSKGNEKLMNLKMRSKSAKLKSVVSQTKSNANRERFSPKSTPKNAKTSSRLNDNSSFDSKKISTISGIRNKTRLTLSAAKRRRSIDPVASLNASIKAKSQLRTQDGKFARNPNKDSPAKLDVKLDDGKAKSVDPDGKSKLKVMQKLKKAAVQSPRRVTRLSSDSDKMPTLEPVVQIVSSNEEYTDKSANDLPILSPVMSSTSVQEQKTSQTITKCALKEKESNVESRVERDSERGKNITVSDVPSEVKKLLFSLTDEEDVLNILEVITNDTGPRRSLRQSAPKLKTSDETLRESEDETDNSKGANNANFETTPESSTKEQKLVRARKSKEKLKDAAKCKEDSAEKNKSSKNNLTILKEERVKSRKNSSVNNSAEEASKADASKKDSKAKKEGAKEIRSSSKTRIEKDSEKGVKLPDVPFEVKKLLFSFTSEEEDVLSILEVISNDTGPRRSLRQSTPKLKSDESLRQPDDELDGSKSGGKKKKIEILKKSLRKNIEKKSTNDVIKASSENDAADEEQNANSLPSRKDNRADAKTKEVDILNIEDKINANDVPPSEGEGDSSQKSNGTLEKRRSRNRSIDGEAEKTNAHTMEKKGCVVNEASNEKEVDRQLEGAVSKANSKSESDDEIDSNSDDRSDSAMVNLNLSHLQSETSNLSIDSGKENSLETSVNVHSKLKVTRPKKTWGARRERSSRKRSLSNVIGILTEGMNSKNIPVEAQQSVQVLTVQTSLDNPDRVMRNGNAQQPTTGGADNMTAVDTTFSDLSSVLSRSEQGSMEDEVIVAVNTGSTDRHSDDEKNACPDNTQNENSFSNQKIDVSSNVATAKTHAPADIILDLTRRKPKGKGSFLEKIVSKIAKQKDALLEGEVGSLLDTAADELTSILDEVGSALTDSSENVNSGDTSLVSKDDSSESVMDVSIDKEILTIANSKREKNEKIVLEDVTFERTTDLVETRSNDKENSTEKTEMCNVIENQCDVNNALDKETLAEKLQTSKNRLAIMEEMAKEEVASLEITSDNQSSMTDISTENHNSPDLTEKITSKGKENTKSRRKSRKRSLEDTSLSKKSKRRLKEVIEEQVEDNTPQKELQFDDLIASIQAESTYNVEEEFTQEENKITKISHEDTEIEKIENSLEKSENTDLELMRPEKDLAENCNESNSENSTCTLYGTSDVVKKSTINEEFLAEVKTIVGISKDRTLITDVQLREPVEENAISSLFPKESIKRDESVDKAKKNVDTKRSTSRRVSKRKSQSAIITVDNSASQVSVRSTKSENEVKETSSSVITTDKALESSDEQLIKIDVTNENMEACSKKSSLQTKRKLEEREETQDTNSKSNFVDSTSSKALKKRNAKKKSLADEHLELPEDEPVKIASKLNEESEFCVTDSSERLSGSLEHFKVPEMTNMLQNAKKRGTKRKSLSEDGRLNTENASVEHRVNEESVEISKVSKLLEKTEELEEEETKKSVNGEQSRKAKRLERSNSSGFIGLVSSPAKFPLKKKAQLSNDDLGDFNLRSQNAESTDDLSESSCTSESSYFRKKRFAKKKKREEKNANITVDSSIVDSKKHKRDSEMKADKTKSLLDEHLNLSDSDDIDVPMDIQASLENTKALENIERELELTEKSQNKEKPVTDDPTSKVSNLMSEQTASNNYDSLDDPVTPKKRAAGNFVVVHTKTGEILIVEKRKKLTKEVARFFCDVCATSFTRKSSLKKHTLSQSHLSQVAKVKDKIEPVDNANIEEDSGWKSYEASDQQADDVSESIQCSDLLKKSLKLDDCTTYIDTDDRQLTESLVNFEVNRQEMLEDKLLDEEICKITENMSHDEYVLTDQVTPEQPISSSTPIKPVQKKQEDSIQSKNGDKRRNKLKRNLAEEHLILDSPEMEKSKISSHELPGANNIPTMSHKDSATEKIMETSVQKAEEIAKESRSLDIVETKKQTTETSDPKLSYKIDMKSEQSTESSRTTRSTLRKLTKTDTQRKEDKSPVLNETNRFSLRPRRSKNFQHYEESDIESYVYFMDSSSEFNNDEMEDSSDAQKTQHVLEAEIDENTSLEKLHTETKDTKGTRPKRDSSNDTKKKKRGRPKVKSRVATSSSVASEETGVQGDSSVAALEESKVKDQNLDTCIKEGLSETQLIAAAVQPVKRSRGRPRKNHIQIASSSAIQMDSSTVFEPIKANCDETKEQITQLESSSDVVVEKTTWTNLIASNIESSSIVEDYALQSSSSDTKKNLLDIEKIRHTDLSISKDQSRQEKELTNIETNDAVSIFARKHNSLSLHDSSKEDKDDLSASETNAQEENAKCISEKKSDINVSDQISRTSDEASAATEGLKLVEEEEALKLDDENADKHEIQKLTDIIELPKEKQTKPEEVILPEDKILEAVREETKLSLVSEDSENEVSITDDEAARVASSYELLAQKKDEDANVCDERSLLESSKKSLRGSSQSKERNEERRKSKTSKDRRKRVAASKISELSSDSENESRIESASSNKSKIVKSVFGRVFGCEKADKVKEVLNDWVSRSEDDSTDVSRSDSETRYCSRASTKVAENGYKKDKKRHSGSNAKKSTERSERSKKKGSSAEAHGKSKNRKKQEKEFDSTSEDCIESIIYATKRKSRESKIRADERILRSFDDESPIVSEMENVDGIKETQSQFENGSLSEKDKISRRHQEKEWNEERAKNKNAISEGCESPRAKHDAHGKSKNSSSHRKKQDTRDERSSSPSQFNMFKYRRRESKIKAGERIWKTFGNETLGYICDERDFDEARKMEQETEFYEAENANHSSDSKSVRQANGSTWKALVAEENQDQSRTSNRRGKTGKDSSNYRREDISTEFADKHKTDKTKLEKLSRDFEHTVTASVQEPNNRTQNLESVYNTSKYKDQSDDLSTKLNQSRSSVKASKRGKRDNVNENWKHSARKLKFDQEDVAEDDQPIDKDIRRKTKQSLRSNLADDGLMKDISEGNFQTVPGSDNDGNDEKEEEDEDDDEDGDNEVDKRRMSPLYARLTPDSSMESSSNDEEEEEEEEDDEEEDEQATHEDNSRKTNSNEFSGEKIIIRSPSSGHRSDVVTIAPTDAIEDNALDVPREIASATEPRQGKILNFDEELFVECCSRLKATSENELRGAKKIKLDHTESYHRREDQSQGFKINRDRWRDVESQNSLGSLLESVNQVSIKRSYIKI